MSLTRKLALVVTFIAILSPRPARADSAAGVVAGRSLGGIHIGESRTDLIAAMKKRPSGDYDLKKGLVEDEWDVKAPDGRGQADGLALAVWYRRGRVVQAEYSRMGGKGLNLPPLSVLIANDRDLRKICYGMGAVDPSGDPSGADGYVLFCFDDVGRGVAYGISGNGDSYLDDRPDRVIVHAPGVPFIARRGLTNARLQTGSGAVIYRNEAEQDKADAAQTAAWERRRKRNR